ncbi:MAG TPA: peptidoglycan-binding protein [Kofleriaceae bacterium]|nr:peptidoglycan-binding protein [Kofleriaceae bacterium]
MADLVIDFASTDSTQPPDLDKAKAAGMRIAVARAIYTDRAGKLAHDPNWELNKDRFGPAGVKSSGYLFLTFPTSAQPSVPMPEAQAEAMHAYCQLDPNRGNYPPIIDVEQDTSIMSFAQKIAWVNRAIKRLWELYGVLPIVYSGDRVWIEVLGNPSKAKAGLLGMCMMWIAKPWPWATRTVIHLDGAPNWQPNTIEALGDGTFWLWYQYQGDALKMPGFPAAVDASRVGPVIKRGNKGTIVAFIQQTLGAIVDGDFGPATEKAVKTFQAASGLTADGLVYVDTWQKLLWKVQPPGSYDPAKDPTLGDIATGRTVIAPGA